MRLLNKLEARIEAYQKNGPAEVERKRDQLKNLQTEINNLTEFIMGGDTSDVVRSVLSDKEAELKSVQVGLIQAEAAAPKIRLHVTREWVVRKLKDLTCLLNSRADKISLVRLELKNLLADKILMQPVGTGQNGYYVATVKGLPLNIFKGSQSQMMVNSATGI